MVFVGRRKELGLLEDAYRSERNELVVLYGRRRIGKSSLVEHFARDKKHYFSFEAVEGGSTREQIDHFTEMLLEQWRDPILESVVFKNWERVFSYLTGKISEGSGQGKTVLFFDELQWMAAGRSKLISLLKYYWDNHWKNKNVMLILCGSIASFMVKKVLRSHALYGRITLEILLKGLDPGEAALMFKEKRSKEEILKYLLVMGGVPKYLEGIDLNKSFNQNINRMFFSPYGIMTGEVERIFFSQFREVQTYKKIVYLLKDGIYSFKEIGEKLGISSGGGLKLYLENLEHAEIIRHFIPFDKGLKSKIKKYSLADEYLLFYFKYVEPNSRVIKESSAENLFETLTARSLDSWLGFAFERFCLKHSAVLSELMGFKNYVLLACPYFGKGDEKFQVDLLYRRSDNVITICEIKYRNEKTGLDIIPEMERKCALLDIPKGFTLEKALISLYGPNDALAASGYFNYSITLDDIIPS